MQARKILQAVLFAALVSAVPAWGQSLRLPQRAEPGLDPSLASGWLAPRYDRFGFANFQWKDAVGFAPSSRMNWSYAFGERGDLGMSYSSASREPAAFDGRQYGVFGRYSLSQDWSLSAEALSRDPGMLLRLHDLRIGVQRRF